MSPRAVNTTKENSKQRTRCVTSEFQLGFSQVGYKSEFRTSLELPLLVTVPIVPDSGMLTLYVA